MGNIYYCYEKKKVKDQFTPYISLSEICDLPLIMWLPSTSNKNRKKSEEYSSYL
jgi:hypothetical protein